MFNFLIYSVSILRNGTELVIKILLGVWKRRLRERFYTSFLHEVIEVHGDVFASLEIVRKRRAILNVAVWHRHRYDDAFLFNSDHELVVLVCGRRINEMLH